MTNARLEQGALGSLRRGQHGIQYLLFARHFPSSIFVGFLDDFGSYMDFQERQADRDTVDR